MSEETRTCKGCGKTRPIEEFPEKKNSQNYRYRSGICIDCYRAKQREYYHRAAARKRESSQPRETYADPWGMLAADVLLRAIHDWERWRDVDERPKNLNGNNEPAWVNCRRRSLATRKTPFKLPREDLEAFFGDLWFIQLCDIVGVHPDVILRKVGLPPIEEDPPPPVSERQRYA